MAISDLDANITPAQLDGFLHYGMEPAPPVDDNLFDLVNLSGVTDQGPSTDVLASLAQQPSYDHPNNTVFPTFENDFSDQGTFGHFDSNFFDMHADSGATALPVSDETGIALDLFES